MCRIKVWAKLLAGRGDRVRVRIVPEKVQIIPVRGDSRQQYEVAGIVKAITHEKDRIRVTVDLGIILEIPVAMEAYLKNPPLVGQQVRVHIPMEAVVIC